MTALPDDTGLRAIRSQERLPHAHIHPSPGLAEWLKASGGSLLFSTYQSGRLYMLGCDPSGELHALERVVGTAMGLHVDREKLWVANREQVWRFSNVGAGHIEGVDYDAIYMPRTGWFIGDSDAHDIVVDAHWKGMREPLVYANTRFSCLAALDEHHSFRPLWVPPFISMLAPDDRCHLNGICEQNGEIAFATLCAQTDAPIGWRNRDRIGRGIVMDMRTNNVVCRGLTMPHSPRWYDGKLWLLDSGTATFGYVDFDCQVLVPVATLPGFARGLAFVNGFAVIGLSLLRQVDSGVDFGLREVLESRRMLQQCGIVIVDLNRSRIMHWLRIEGSVTELYDVAFAPGLRRVWTPGFREPALHKSLMTAPDIGLPAALRPSPTDPLPTTAWLAADPRRGLPDRHAAPADMSDPIIATPDVQPTVME